MAKANNQEGGVNINQSKSVIVKGDLVGRDKITNTILHQDNNLVEILNLWQKQIETDIEKIDLSVDEKNNIKNQINAIKSAIITDKAKNPKRLEKIINTIATMSLDIFDVVITTLANPLAGIGLVLKKIGDRASLAKTDS